MSAVEQYHALQPLRHIRRFALYPTLAPITVAEHSFYVGLLAAEFARSLLHTRYRFAPHPLVVLEAGLWHDAGEAIAGDVPHSFKRAAPGLAPVWDAAEEAARATLPGVPGPAGPVADILVKMADWVELLLYAQTEAALGSRMLQGPAARIWELLGGVLMKQAHEAGLGDWYAEALQQVGADMERGVIAAP